MATLSVHDAIQGETLILCDGADDAKLSLDLKASKESIPAGVIVPKAGSAKISIRLRVE